MACTELVPTMDFFVQRLGFRIDAIFPADAPATAILSGHGLTLHLSRHATHGVPALRLLCTDPDAVAGGVRDLVAPNGVQIRLSHIDPPMHEPANRQALVVSRRSGDTATGPEWVVGRAGLRYRDLLPDRHGGAFIASHIAILEGGPVPDYVHYHKVRFQMIFCRKGWVKLAYEGQGAPFLLEAGDCVLQPPTIRHRVLESSAGAEVIEIGSPAEHITMADHDMPLPNAALPPDHVFGGADGGQRFTRHIRSAAAWEPWRLPGFEAQTTGIEAATDGLAGVRVVRASSAAAIHGATQRHASAFCFFFVLQGQLSVAVDGTTSLCSATTASRCPGAWPTRCGLRPTWRCSTSPCPAHRRSCCRTWPEAAAALLSGR
jgi:quercetin dioxygenase-like cupin family protein